MHYRLTTQTHNILAFMPLRFILLFPLPPYRRSFSVCFIMTECVIMMLIKQEFFSEV